MKKVVSLLLCVMMVAGLFVALIPAASAATKTTLSSAQTPPTYTLGEAWYTEDFESVSASLTNADLFAALGWDEGDKTFPGGTLAVVAKGENQWVSLKGSATVIPFLTDDRLAGGDYYVEYTQKMISNTSGDGQGLGIVSGGYGTTDVQTAPTSAPLGNRKLIWQWNVKERGDLDTLAYFPAYLSSTDICHSIDQDTSTTASANGGNTRGSLVDKEIRFRIIIDADYGLSAYTLDASGNATPVAYMSSATNVELWKANASMIANYLSFRILGGPVVQVDDLKVGSLVKAEKEAAEPGLVISEVATNARAAFTASDGATHRFEWIEVYNASTEAKNIYDYALVRRSGFHSYTKKVTTAEDGTSTTTYSVSNNLTGAISDSEWYTISYPAEKGGECIATRTDKTYEYKFTNPVYAEGVLQPGETAILVNASDWWNGYYNADSLTATVDIFKSDYLIANLGYTQEQVDAMNIINCSAGKGTTSFGMNNSGADLIGLAPLAEDGSCPAVGNHFYDPEYVETYVVDVKKISGSSKTTTSGTSTIVTTSGIIDNHIYMAGQLRSAYTVAHYYAQEYCHFDANGNYLGTGLAVSGRNPGSNVQTVGSVLEDQRRPFKVNYVSDGATYKTELGYLKTDYTVTTDVPTKEGYAFVGWVDANGNPATDIAAADMTCDVTYYATWEYVGPTATMVGTQSTYLYDDGTFDVRFVARLGAVENVADIENVHFELSLASEAITGSSSTFITNNVYLEYLYKTLSTDFGSDSLTEADGVYYVALHLNNAPEGVTYKVKPVITLTDGSVNEGTEATYTPVGLRQNIDYMHLSFDDGYKCFQNLTNNTYNSVFEEPFFAWMKEMHDEYGATFSIYVFNDEFEAFANSANGAKFASEFQANKTWLKLGLHSPANDQTINFNVDGYNTFEAGYEQWTKFLTSAMIVTGNDPDCIDKFHRLHNFAGADAAISGMIHAGIDFAANTADTTDTAEDYRPAGFYAADDTRDSYYLDSTLSQWLNANDHLNDTGKDLTLVATDIRAEYFSTAPTRFTYDNMYEELYYRHTVAGYEISGSSMIIFSHESRIQNDTDNVKASMEAACKFAKDFGIKFGFSDSVTYPTTEQDINTPVADKPVEDSDSGDNTGSGLGSNVDTGIELPEIQL